MVTKYLSTFYSYKFVPEAYRLVDQNLEEPSSALEQQVQRRMTQGHQHFFQGRYQEALQEYQSAYTLLHRFLHPEFPDRVLVRNHSLLRTLDISNALLAASGEVARYRQVAGPARPIVAPADPPQQVTAIVQQYGAVGTAYPPSSARNYYHLATNYLQIGAISQAQSFLRQAMKTNQGQDIQLEADLNTAMGVSLMSQNAAEAGRSFTFAQELYVKLQLQSEVAVVNNNLGVLHTLAGNAQAAGAAFQAAGDRLPLSLGRTLMQPLNPGTASTMTRPLGSEGLYLIFPSAALARDWMTVSATTPPAVGAQHLGVLVGSQVTVVNLQEASEAELKQKIYLPRITANTLEALWTYEDLPFNFVAYLTHVYGFILPISIGDCYFELGEYEQALQWYQQARDYAYLNQPIEAPMVWLKMANAYLRWGTFFYKNGDKAEARVRYEKIVRLTGPILDPASPLYLSPMFDGLKAQVQALLTAPQPPDINVHNPAIATVVLLARLNIQNIQAGIDLPLLSLEREQVPVFTFEYLQNVARYFAQHAIDTERTYINFKTSAEQGTLTRAELANVVDLGYANEALEQKKVDVANAQKTALDANFAYADKQWDNAKHLKEEYQGVNQKENALNAEITYVGAPTTEYDFSGYSQYGVSNGKHRADEVLRTLTQRRQEISRDFELHNMDRRISELEAARTVAVYQKAVAQAQVDAAKEEQNIATLRRQQAEQQLALFDSQEFTPDLWNRLANEIKSISESYLQQAIIIAKLMEQSFEFEIGEPVNIIKPNYGRNDLSGLLAGDFLLQDIDSFTFLRIIHTRKKQPMKEVISLADHYPVQFLREFQRTGQMNFRTALSDFDRNYPGGYQQRIKRVEVVVEGLIGQGGIHGTLTNTGQCLTRLYNGKIQMRLLRPETLLLSAYRIGPDSIVFTPDQEMLTIFENSPVATSWELELRPSVNDLIYNYITDLKLVLYYESFYDENLKPLVLEELAEAQPITGKRTVALRYELFDEFFAFQDTGQVRFTLRNTMLPFYHTDPRIREMTILVQSDDGVSPAGLVIQVSAADGTHATQTSDADGAISTDAGAPLSVCVGRPLLQEWTIAIPQAPNQARFNGGFQWSQVNNIVLVAEYEFTPRRIAGEPYLLLRDEFKHDSLLDYDLVDDPQANQDTPSNWIYSATAGHIEQHSSIHGGPDGPTATDAVKPGTYLIRKSGAALPNFQDFILTSHLHSQNDGGIGLIFRWQDADNFYYFLMDSQRHYRRIGKKVGGVFQELSTPAIYTTEGYIVGQVYSAKVRAKGQSLQVYLDGTLVLSGQDASLPGTGRVGFFSWDNPGAQFNDLQVIEL